MEKQRRTDVNIEGLRRAYKMLVQFIERKESEQEQAGIIKAFEYCYELAWKLLKKVLSNKGVDVASPKNTFREAARNKLIDDPKIWFDLEESDITIKVDVLDVRSCSPEFMEVIEKGLVEIR